MNINDEYDDEEESRRTRKKSKNIPHRRNESQESVVKRKNKEQTQIMTYKHKRHEMFKAFVMEQASIDAQQGRGQREQLIQKIKKEEVQTFGQLAILMQPQITKKAREMQMS